MGFVFAHRSSCVSNSQSNTGMYVMYTSPTTYNGNINRTSSQSSDNDVNDEKYIAPTHTIINALPYFFKSNNTLRQHIH